MAEYIEREAVHRLVRSLNRYIWKNPDKSKYRTTVDIDDVQFSIDKIPTADVVEVRCGRWIKRQLADEPTAFGYRCSECHLTYEVDTNYCPNCGAKMDGKVCDDK